MLITDSDSLATFFRKLEGVPYVAIDTEFVREKTYYAQLCLVQVAHGEHAAAIDTLVEDLDLRPLTRLLNDPAVVKVFHSATQDLQIFLQATGRLPAPIFDSQVAAGVCGHGEQPGYARLVSSMLDVEIDKTSQATDWARRPLTDAQLEYALSDVTHLCTLYEQLSDELVTSGRTSWIAEEMAALTDPARYTTEPADAYRGVKIRRPTRQALAVLRELAAWREEAAKARNLPRRWVVKDEALVEIAQQTPDSPAELAHVRGLSAHVAHGDDGAAMLEAVARALALDEDQWPEMRPRRDVVDGSDTLVALLQALLRLRCDAHGVAMKLVATRSDLEALAWGSEEDLPQLKGWRREIFGADAVALMEGRLALTGRDGEVATLPVAAPNGALTR